ncbi:DsbA family protein [Vibrio sp. Y2-5]|uniref:DsbA family protein n=1 Tax=Vibrio sp. Y2-5 TaxID=2743977 RepID=UPI001660C5EC|nr:DsbA family protein [Vibrio sp. Y2-5]MBD0788131.1 DsbA family protein [Vibrio sp. Y2-5]
MNKFQKFSTAAFIGLIITNGLLIKRVSVLEQESNKSAAEQFKKYIMDNPQDLISSLQKFDENQRNEAKELLAIKARAHSNELRKDASDPHLGNPNGKHLIVAFLDYNCGYCRQTEKILEQLLATDPEAKVIVKEFPIFPDIPSSAYAAKMGVAINKYRSKLYNEYHTTLMSATKALTIEEVDQVIINLGIDIKELNRFAQEAEEHVQLTHQLAQNIGVTGTPTMFVGKNMEPLSTVETLEPITSLF